MKERFADPMQQQQQFRKSRLCVQQRKRDRHDGKTSISSQRLVTIVTSKASRSKYASPLENGAAASVMAALIADIQLT